MLQILELLRDEALAVHERLLADIVLRHLVFKGVRDLDVVPEHLVVADFQRADAGALLLARLHGGDDALAAVENVAQAVDLRVIALADHLALADGKRRLIDERLADEGGDVAERIELVVQLAQAALFKALELRAHRRELQRGVFQRGEVASAGRTVDNAAHEPLHIADARERDEQLLARHRLVHERLHRTLAAADGVHVEQRPLQKAAQAARAHGGLRLVEHPQQAPALALAAERLRQFKVAAGGEIQLHELPLSVKIKAVDVGEVSLLRLVQVIEQRPQRQHGRRVLARQPRAGVLAELLARQALGRLHRHLPLFAVAVKFALEHARECLVEKRPVVHHGLRR